MKPVALEWGPAGAATLAQTCDVLVLVDVLSFTTCVSIACGRGASVWPHRWRDDSAAVRAAELDAVVAGPRGSAVSLSPLSVLTLPTGARLVLLDRGFADDVLLAAEEGADHAVPVLADGACVDAAQGGP